MKRLTSVSAVHVIISCLDHVSMDSGCFWTAWNQQKGLWLIQVPLIW